MFKNMGIVTKLFFFKLSLIKEGFTYNEAHYLTLLHMVGKISERDAREIIKYVEYFPAGSEHRHQNFVFYTSTKTV